MSPTAKTSGCPGRLRSGSTAIRPARSVSAPVASASMPASGEAWTPAAQMTVPQSKRPFVALRALGVDAEGIDTDDAQSHAQLDAHLLELGGGAPREVVAEGGQRLLAAVDQDDPDRRRVDAAEVLGQAPVRQLADLPGQLDAGRPGSDDDEGHPEPLQRAIAQRLGDLESAVDAAPQLHGVVDRLHAGGDHGELVVAEVRLPGARRHDEAVVGVLAVSPGSDAVCTTRRSRSNPVTLDRTTVDVLAACAACAAARARSAPGERMPVATW